MNINKGKQIYDLITKAQKLGYPANAMCGDIYDGLKRLINPENEFIVLDNPEQYKLMCLDDRWITGNPISNHNGYLSFDYTDSGYTYPINGVPNPDGTVTFYVVK